MDELHVYRNDVIEWVIAGSLEEAAALLRRHYELDLGYLPDDMPECFDLTQEPDDKPLRMYDEDDDARAEKTCAEWAATYGLGLLGSTEW